MDPERLKNPGPADLRTFGLLFAGFVVLIFGLILPWRQILPWGIWAWLVAAAFAALALGRPLWLKGFYGVWIKLGMGINWVVTRVILGTVFFGMIVPMGLVMRLLGKDPMRRKTAPVADSYRVPSHERPRNSLERPF